MKIKNSCAKGFTLIELLVVVLIIGILAAVALPQYERAVWRSRFSEVYTVTRALENSLNMYVLENDYPSTTIYLTPDDLDVDSLSSLTPGRIFDQDAFCSKYACYYVRCNQYHCSWYAMLYKDAQNPSYENSIAQMSGTIRRSDEEYVRANTWYRSCRWEPGLSTEQIGKYLCTATQWDDIDAGY